jgi:hypothetical protein
MESSISQTARSVNWLRWIARVLVSCWAAFWVFFIGAYLIGGLSKPVASEGLEGFAFVTLGLILVVGITWLAWRKEKVGRIVLVVVGLALGVGYLIWPPPHMHGVDYFLTSLMIGGPPLLTGLLFFLSRTARIEPATNVTEHTPI